MPSLAASLAAAEVPREVLEPEELEELPDELLEELLLPALLLLLAPLLLLVLLPPTTLTVEEALLEGELLA
jgi:hypothetical protein